MYKMLLIRYGELGLKGKNKIKFIERLTHNIRNMLQKLEGVKVHHTWGRLWVELESAEQLDDAERLLKKVFGIYSISPVVQCKRDFEEIKTAALNELQKAFPEGGTFKVRTKRADKTFPMLSPEISKEVGAYILQNTAKYHADMHEPEFYVDIEIRQEGVFVYSQVIPGAKGLPVGCSGKAMLMLSGGIDSPVAGYLAMKRGVVFEAVHFESFPFTGEQAKQKVIDLCKVLAAYRGAGIKVHMIHFTDIQKAIHLNCPEEYGITLIRRMMFRIVEKLALGRQAGAIYTGECVGQVASQTLESMFVINNVVNIPVLRPCVGMDKEEIVAIAQKIGTFDISIRPYEDCCTVFLPEYPVIRPSLKAAEEYEKALDIEALIQNCLSQSTSITVRP